MFQDARTLSHEAVLFFAEGVVRKQMLLGEFESVLDGVVGLTDFAGRAVRAAYLILNSQLKIKHCVLFTIGFDRAGMVDRSWNLPLRHLADTAGQGPDLGAGPIRLACRSQCSIAWHADALWDPDMSSQGNTFLRLLQAINENRLHLPRVEAVPESPGHAPSPWQSTESSPFSSLPSFAGGPSFTGSVAVPPVDIPVATPALARSEPRLPLTPETSVPESVLLERQKALLEEEHRRKLAALLKEQRHHIQALKSESEQTISALTLKMQKELHAAEIELARMESLNESLRAQNMTLSELNQSHHAQLEALKKTHDMELMQLEHIQQEALEELRKTSDLRWEKRVAEDARKFKAEIAARDAELALQQDNAKSLIEEVCQLRKDKLRLLNQGADKFFERLEALGVSFIAFHPGAGHLSVPLKDMVDYMEKPLAFAAAKCMVSEAHYSAWLAHYQSPQCQASLTADKVCGSKITRIDVPGQFVAGESDRCEKHRPRSLTG